MRQRILVFLLLAFTLAAARAQTVHWEPSDAGPGAIQLVFEDCSTDTAPTLPAVPGVTFTFRGQSSSTRMNGFADVHTSLVLTYSVQSRQNAPVQIPAFKVNTNKGPQTVPAFDLGAPATVAAASLASSKLLPERTTVWAGEVFNLGYQLSAARRVNPQITPNFDWTPGPLVIEDWSKPEVADDSRNGERRIYVDYRTRAFVAKPNTFKLEAVSHAMSVQTGTYTAAFFQQPRMEPISVTSDQPTLEVRALPPAPAGFGGAVGQFKLVSKVVPEKAAPGEPVTWTLELSGTGNWPAIEGLPQRDVSTDFQVVQPKAKRTPAEGKLFDSTLTEDVVLVPTKPGTYALGPVKLVYFDPKSGTYQTLTTPRTTVTVAVPEASKLFPSPGPAPAPSADDAARAAESASKIEALKSKNIAPPPAIPNAPLAGSALASAPLSNRTVLLFSLAPFAALLVAWGTFAHRRARLTDPLRPLREARDRLAATLVKIQAPSGSMSGSGSGAQPSALSSQLLQWQRDSAILWQLAHAAPGASAFVDPAWATLWSEADRALYGAKPDLPSDWVARAQAALAAKRVPRANPLRAFLPRNLFPFAALIVFALLVPGQKLHAADATPTSSTPAAATVDGRAAYDRGDFAAAEKSWRAALARNPTDWVARHNLSLALVQQDRAGEAAAHAGAAFVQNPADPSVRWHLAVTGEKAGFAPAPLAPFLRPVGLPALARYASPARWQYVLIGCSALVALGLGLLLTHWYAGRSTTRLSAAVAALTIGALGGGTAMAGWQAYGVAANANAVVVWHAATLRSIPTDADTTQKTTPLNPGSVAVANKTFLTWTRLAFDNGQTGWVPTADLVPLWH